MHSPSIHRPFGLCFVVTVALLSLLARLTTPPICPPFHFHWSCSYYFVVSRLQVVSHASHFCPLCFYFLRSRSRTTNQEGNALMRAKKGKSTKKLEYYTEEEIRTNNIRISVPIQNNWINPFFNGQEIENSSKKVCRGWYGRSFPAFCLS